MFHQGNFRSFFIVERRRFVEDRKVPGLFDVCAGAGDQPERIVVEAASDVRISALGQRLVLMVRASVRKLDRRDIDDPLPCPLRDQVDKAQKILAAVPDILNVTMHWYWFQILTIRSSSCSELFTVKRERS